MGSNFLDKSFGTVHGPQDILEKQKVALEGGIVHVFLAQIGCSVTFSATTGSILVFLTTNQRTRPSAASWTPIDRHSLVALLTQQQLGHFYWVGWFGQCGITKCGI